MFASVRIKLAVMKALDIVSKLDSPLLQIILICLMMEKGKIVMKHQRKEEPNTNFCNLFCIFVVLKISIVIHSVVRL